MDSWRSPSSPIFSGFLLLFWGWSFSFSFTRISPPKIYTQTGIYLLITKKRKEKIGNHPKIFF